MIRLSCPGCEKVLRVPDQAAGKVVNCPACKMKFQVPAADPEPDLAPDPVPPPPPAPRRGSGTTPRLPAPPPPPRDEFDDRPRRRDDDDDDDREYDRPRRKPKRRAGGGSSGFPVMPVTIAGVAVALAALGLSFIFGPCFFVSLLVGWLMSMAGGIWMLVIAFQEDVTQGLLCLFVPFYGLYYLISRFDRCREAGILQIGGFVVLIACSILMCFGAAVAFNQIQNIQQEQMRRQQRGGFGGHPVLAARA